MGVDATFVLEKETTYEEVCAKMKEAAEGPMKGVLGYCTDKIVSSDCLGDSRSSIFDFGAVLLFDDGPGQGYGWKPSKQHKEGHRGSPFVLIRMCCDQSEECGAD